MIEAAEQHGDDYDLSSLVAVSSTAAVFSPSVKDQFFARFPSLMITDAIGSSESGANGYVLVQPGNTTMKGGPTVTAVARHRRARRGPEAGRGRVGGDRQGRRAKATSPFATYKDEQKTAETFVTVSDGVRYAIPGDFATVEADGTITLLGRGSTVDQLRRREDLPRGGRGGGEVASRRCTTWSWSA